MAFFYPGYKSFKAIQASNPEEDKKWLTYWIVFGFWHSVDDIFDMLLYFIPFLQLVKFLILVSLYAPGFNTSVIVFDKVIDPTMTVLKPYLEKPMNILGKKLMLQQ